MAVGRSQIEDDQSTQFPSAHGQELLARGGCGNLSPIRTETIDHDFRLSDATLVAAWSLIVSIHCLTEDVVFGLALEGLAHQAFQFRVHVPEGDVTSSNLVVSVRSTLDQLGAPTQENECSTQGLHDDTKSREACAPFSCLQISSSASTDSARHSPQPQSQSSALLIKCHKHLKSTEVSVYADANKLTPMVSQSLLAQFKMAIAALSSDQETRLNDINLLDGLDFNQLHCWTQAPEPIASQPLLHKVVEEQALLYPLAVAIGQSDSVMTYAELDKGASALARHMIASVPSKGKVGNIAIFFSKSAFAILAMLAVLKAGGAFVPVDTQWPAKRVNKVFANTQVTAILCSEDQQSRLEAFSSIKVICVTPKLIYTLKKAEKNGSPAPLPLVQPESPAYIMHTSGSTGQPKGIEISHRSITTSLNAMARYFGTNSSTRTLQFSAFTFDVSVADIWTTLSRGGRVCMPREEQRFSLNDFILAERCNNAFVTPSVAATIDPDIPRRHLRKLAVIGEAVKPEFLRKYAPRETESQRAEGLVLCNTWGPTEASVFGTGSSPIRICPDGHTLVQRAGNIGWPVGCGLFIVSARNPHILSPAYAPGEIALVGPTLATGYWADEAMTKAAFRTDLEWTKDKRWRERFGDVVMGRVYLTGDIGRYSEQGDGSVIFMHRRGGYMKVNGLRIEPGEVESAIAEVGSKLSKGSQTAMPHWSRTVVCVLERTVRGAEQQLLICYLANSEQAGEPGAGCEQISMDAEGKALLRDVAKNLRDVIPEYMVPRLFVSVAKMPFTTSFKVDRKALLGLFDEMDWTELVKKYSVESDCA